MGIKNWTVSVETVKSVGTREVYFENENEPSHANTLSMTPIFGNKAHSMLIQQKCEEAKAEQRIARKGGRPPTPALEFVFVLPSDVDVSGTDEDWQRITYDMVKDLANTVGVDPRELARSFTIS